MRSSSARGTKRTAMPFLRDSSTTRCKRRSWRSLATPTHSKARPRALSASVTAADMGVVAAKAAMERAGVCPEQIEETIFGNARQAGGGPNVARQISILSGVPQEVPAYTVNKACASGMKSIALGFHEIATG